MSVSACHLETRETYRVMIPIDDYATEEDARRKAVREAWRAARPSPMEAHTFVVDLDERLANDSHYAFNVTLTIVQDPPVVVPPPSPAKLASFAAVTA